MWIVELALWIVALVTNIWLMKQGRRTISQRYHDLFPQWADYIVMGVSIVLQIFLYWKGWFLAMTGLGDAVVCIIRNKVFGHWFWHED